MPSDRGKKDMDFQLTSAAFVDRQRIPIQYTCDGTNISPPLDWQIISNRILSFALILEDVDSIKGTWGHWVIINIPESRRSLPENIPNEKNPEGMGIQGINDYGAIGYGGPCPQKGEHRYIFNLFALDRILYLKESITRYEVRNAIEGNFLASCQLTVLYERRS
ncbi:MAG TPA: YbhB/YbcL family Raf kinase inhibitor-like protein [Candidatus Margulisbacteria bacterium]|nr:YbhB/YbcL family Raf kinase inhibitor-like protein [Candidatus Margulisiibacteriota bacterium]